MKIKIKLIVLLLIGTMSLGLGLKAETKYYNMVQMKDFVFDLDLGIYSDVPITVKKDVKYTFFLNGIYYGQGAPYLDLEEYYLEIDYEGIDDTWEYRLVYDEESKSVGAEFEAKSNQINRIHLPLPDEGVGLNQAIPYVVLYEGGFKMFPGFRLNNKPESGIYDVPEEYVYFVSTHNLETLDEIIENIQVTNPIPNSNREHLRVKIDKYSKRVDLYKEGDYPVIIYFMSDDNYIFSALNILIRVVDVTGPVFIGPSELLVSVENDDTIEVLIADYYYAEDESGIETEIIIINEDYQPGVLGFYNVELETEDLKGNISNKIIQIEVEDTINPVIVGPKNVYTYKNDEVLEEADILKLFKITDNDQISNSTVLMEDYLLTPKEPGIYQALIKATDRANNITEYTINIVVLNDEVPGFILNNDLFIDITTANQMTDQDIKEWIYKELSANNFNVSNLMVLHNEYNESKIPGEYYVYYSYDFQDKTYNNRVLINVTQEPNKASNKTIIIASSIAGILLISLAITSIILKRKKTLLIDFINN